MTYETDDSSSETYLYERESKTLSLLFQHHPQLNEYALLHSSGTNVFVEEFQYIYAYAPSDHVSD